MGVSKTMKCQYVKCFVDFIGLLWTPAESRVDVRSGVQSSSYTSEQKF